MCVWNPNFILCGICILRAGGSIRVPYVISYSAVKNYLIMVPVDASVSNGMIFCQVTNLQVVKYIPAYWVPFGL